MFPVGFVPLVPVWAPWSLGWRMLVWLCCRVVLVLEGGRGARQPARIYSSQESSRSEALKLYRLIGKYPLKEKKRKIKKGRKC